MNIKIALIALITFFAISPSQNVFGDECDDILKHGLFNVVKVKNTETLQSEFYEWLEKADRRDFEKIRGFKLNLPIPLDASGTNFLELGADYNKNDHEKLKSSLKSGKIHKINQAKLTEIFTKTVDKNIVDAWLKCKELQANKVGFNYSLSKEGGIYLLKLSFRGPGTLINAKTLDYKIYTSNCRLSFPNPKETIEKDTEQTLAIIIDNPYEDAIVQIKTEKVGTFTRILPAQTKAVARSKPQSLKLSIVFEKVKLDGGPHPTGGEFEFVPKILQKDGTLAKIDPAFNEPVKLSFGNGAFPREHPFNTNVKTCRIDTDEATDLVIMYRYNRGPGGELFPPAGALDELLNESIEKLVEELEKSPTKSITRRISFSKGEWGYLFVTIKG